MSKGHCLSFLATVIVVLIMMMSLEVDAQSTVDDEASCQSSTLDEALINLIKTGFTDVKRGFTDVNKGFTDVKNLLGSRQQTFTTVDSSSLCM